MKYNDNQLYDYFIKLYNENEYNSIMAIRNKDKQFQELEIYACSAVQRWKDVFKLCEDIPFLRLKTDIIAQYKGFVLSQITTVQNESALRFHLLNYFKQLATLAEKAKKEFECKEDRDDADSDIEWIEEAEDYDGFMAGFVCIYQEGTAEYLNYAKRFALDEINNWYIELKEDLSDSDSKKDLGANKCRQLLQQVKQLKDTYTALVNGACVESEFEIAVFDFATYSAKLECEIDNLEEDEDEDDEDDKEDRREEDRERAVAVAGAVANGAGVAAKTTGKVIWKIISFPFWLIWQLLKFLFGTKFGRFLLVLIILAAAGLAVWLTKVYEPVIDWFNGIFKKDDENDTHVHQYGTEIIAPTCGSQGYTIYTCTCGDSYIDDYIEKTAHTPATAIIENEIVANCVHGGSYDEVVYCSECEEKLSSVHKTVDISEHTPANAVIENEVKANCQHGGSYDEVVYCKVCEEKLSSEHKTVDLTEHTPANAVIENEIVANCQHDGSYDEVIYCSVCNTKINSVHKTVKGEHNIVNGVCADCNICYPEISGSTVIGLNDAVKNAPLITIPSEYNGVVITTIQSSAFSGSEIGGVIIPNTITEINNSAFKNCNKLTSITIPDSVKSISNSAFMGCSRLETVYWNATACITAGSYNYPIFKDCTNLSNVVIGKNVNRISQYVLCGCSSLTSISIPFVGGGDTSNTHLGYIFGAKSYVYNPDYIPSSLKEVVITGGNTIANNAFWDCKGLTNIIIPDSVTSIGTEAFRGCNGLTNIIIPNSVTSIGANAFYSCIGLTSVTIGDGVTSIGGQAFYWCNSLTSIVIGKVVTSIGDYAFWDNKLTRVYYNGTATNWTKIAIGNSNTDLTNATRYYYSETEPSSSGNYWHYGENKEPVVW